MAGRKEERSMGNVLAELKEEHDWRMRLHGEVENLKSQNIAQSHRIEFEVKSLLIGRVELESRIHKIDARIFCLGYDPAKVLREFLGFGDKNKQ